jgi:hypothetical protein
VDEIEPNVYVNWDTRTIITINPKWMVKWCDATKGQSVEKPEDIPGEFVQRGE